MKISQEVAKALAKASRATGVGDDLDGPDGKKIKAYYHDDLTVSFVMSEKPALHGISFESVGIEFTILSDLSLLMSMPKAINEESGEESTEDQIYEIEDPEVLAHFEDYLRWRTVALEKFNI